jgi:hypothetical protein
MCSCKIRDRLKDDRDNSCFQCLEKIVLCTKLLQPLILLTKSCLQAGELLSVDGVDASMRNAPTECA